MTTAVGNKLLDSLPESLRNEILSSSSTVNLPLRTSLEVEGKAPLYAYFLTRGMASVVVELREGGTAEVSLIGPEGLTGSLALLGTSLASTCCFMQVAGAGYKVPMAVVQRLFLSSDILRSYPSLRSATESYHQPTGCLRTTSRSAAQAGTLVAHGQRQGRGRWGGCDPRVSGADAGRAKADDFGSDQVIAASRADQHSPGSFQVHQS